MIKQTVLNASKKLADQISADLLSRTNAKGNKVFKRYEMSNGFEIRYKTSPTEEAIGFKFVDDNGRITFFYESQLLTF
jgi:hypothetical protein